MTWMYFPQVYFPIMMNHYHPNITCVDVHNVLFQCFIKLLFTKVKSLMKIEILQYIPVRSFGILFLIALLCNSLIFFRNLSSMYSTQFRL